ncbi:NUDIX domain-containing protein [Phototrophicus methaneseepsis]|uniref:NUDIX domain-containing protein n=1 Tax=Phototrophicus methaneseepsis TaxID=2710758 RepID=A0A7S8EAM3_9CHLR|nr:NUDIX domain-containing protein [Phototrophicus methaneseepsis]QPC83463.1 NUDIX domain-containing protein [Phototrophicus methaneseepsis]
MKPGRDYIGVGVGAVVFNDAGQVFLAQRGEDSGNERGTWEFPGGRVEFGETLRDAVAREFLEEYGMVIEVGQLLGLDDHILPEEGQHWVAPTYLARHISGEPAILEAGKCVAIGWFDFDALPQPLSIITQLNVQAYQEKNPLRAT